MHKKLQITYKQQENKDIAFIFPRFFEKNPFQNLPPIFFKYPCAQLILNCSTSQKLKVSVMMQIMLSQIIMKFYEIGKLTDKMRVLHYCKLFKNMLKNMIKIQCYLKY